MKLSKLLSKKYWNKRKRVILLFFFFPSSFFSLSVLRPDLTNKWKIIILRRVLLPCYGRMKFIFAFYWHHLFLFWQASKTASNNSVIRISGLVLKYSVVLTVRCSKLSFFIRLLFFFITLSTAWHNKWGNNKEELNVNFLYILNSYLLEMMKKFGNVFRKNFAKFFHIHLPKNTGNARDQCSSSSVHGVECTGVWSGWPHKSALQVDLL